MHGNYEIHYTKAADRFFNVHEDIRVKYEDAIRKILSDDPAVNVDIKRIRGKHSVYFRMRLGNYRVIYTVINGRIVVITTLPAGSRGDVYKKVDGLE